MKYKYLVLDTNNFYWRCITSCIEKSMKLEDYIVSNDTIIQFLKNLKDLINRFAYEDSTIYFLCDNPKSKINERKDLSNGQYKHSRENKNLPKNIYKTFNILIEILKSYSDNFKIVQCDGYEADDLTLPILEHIKKQDKNTNVLVVSADLDWARNICDK